MNELREDLDRALRSVTFSEAPVERAKRDGRRIRNRRRAALLAGALAVAAVAAGYPALAGSSAAPPAPATGLASAAPSPSPSDMAVNAYPAAAVTQAPGGLASKTGEVAAGSVGKMKWQVSVVPPGKKNPVPADSCYTVTIIAGTGVTGTCHDIPPLAGNGLSAVKPAAFDLLSDDGSTVTVVGEASPDVTYLIVTFTDGQQLKLIPVTAGGHRYVAWMAPLSLKIDSVTAHLGGPYSDSGQAATAVPFQQPGQPPVFGLWQRAGQAAPPRDTRLIGAGTTGGRAWKASASEGPWGTCFTVGPSGWCVPLGKLDTTTVIVFGGGAPVDQAFGTAAPGVASVRITLSNGKKVTARPVGVGNEDLFAFPTGRGVTAAGWVSYDAAGHQTGAGSVEPVPGSASASGSGPAKP